ncbi:MAG: site-specific integrase, partial [Candidatus Omnitrophica bacterium]|nr:site-specific integrase [Candidatus Omnitrophota bacterium]
MDRYLTKFINYLDIEKNYSRHTILNYESDLNEFLEFIRPRAVDKVDYLLLRQYLGHLRKKHLRPRSMARKLSSIRSYFRFLQREGFIKDNPAVLLMSPKLDKKLPHFLSEEEM